jgi:hypothetical protein
MLLSFLGSPKKLKITRSIWQRIIYFNIVAEVNLVILAELERI